ncbi:MAG: hypothetical protein LBJ90_02600 [Treponema sp.]|jgi:hypothetical protein|nr:hypothetical protein [Treponema sp.]
MKKEIIFTSVLALIFAACATTQNSAPGRTVTGSGAPASGTTPRDAAGQIPVETKSMILFADGTLDEYTTTDYDSSYTNRVNQNRYSASGALLERVEYSYREGKEQPAAKITRDAENQIKNRVAYEYNDRGNLVKETLFNKAEKIVSLYEYGYDNKGNRVSRTVNGGTGIKMAETIYTYNSSGTLESSETKDGAGRKISSTVNQYNSQGNLINQKVMNGDGQVASLINTVWRDGHEIESEQTGQDGSVQLRITNEYGAGGELLKKTVENFQGDSTQIMRYEYTFKPGRR